jgi:hypothetical protein
MQPLRPKLSSKNHTQQERWQQERGLLSASVIKSIYKQCFHVLV